VQAHRVLRRVDFNRRANEQSFAVNKIRARSKHMPTTHLSMAWILLIAIYVFFMGVKNAYY
jgi:hypothetical protein